MTFCFRPCYQFTVIYSQNGCNGNLFFTVIFTCCFKVICKRFSWLITIFHHPVKLCHIGVLIHDEDRIPVPFREFHQFIRLKPVRIFPAISLLNLPVKLFQPGNADFQASSFNLSLL